MGARTVFEVKDREGSIFLYSHWGGDTKLEDAVAALVKAQPRWSDTTYGMRIFISQIIGDAWDSETGYGISAKNVFEEQYAEMVIDFESQTVQYDGIGYSFTEFIEMPPLE
jgi:hypothetical protein